MNETNERSQDFGWQEQSLPVSAATPVHPETIEGRHNYARAARQLAGRAHHALCIYSQELEFSSYGVASFADTVKSLLLLHRHASMRILVKDSRPAARGPHALVDLSRIVTSRAEIRELGNRQLDAAELLIGDGRLLLERRNSGDLDALLYMESPLIARARQRAFDALWEECAPSLNLRRLSI